MRLTWRTAAERPFELSKGIDSGPMLYHTHV